MNPEIPRSSEELSRLICELTGMETGVPGPLDNIFETGIDSLAVFSLLAAWNAAGLNLDYQDLAKDPTIKQWWELIKKKQQGGYV